MKVAVWAYPVSAKRYDETMIATAKSKETIMIEKVTFLGDICFSSLFDNYIVKLHIKLTRNMVRTHAHP